MKKVLHYGVTRFVARVLVVLCLALWNMPPAAALRRPPRPKFSQTPDEDWLQEIRRKQARSARQPDVRELTPAEMKDARGRGPYRNQYFCGTLPWQRSLRDVNLANGNLFKSFTDIQVPPARV